MTSEDRIKKLEQEALLINDKLTKMNTCHSRADGKFCSGGGGSGGSATGLKLNVNAANNAAPMSSKGVQTANVLAERGGNWSASHNDSGIRATRSTGSSVIEVKIKPNGEFRASEHLRFGGTNWVRGTGPDKLAGALTKFGV